MKITPTSHRPSRRTQLLALTAGAVVLAGACGSSSKASTSATTATSATSAPSGTSATTASSGATHSFKGTFNVLMIIGLTGPIAPQSDAEEQGMKAAAANINAQGGILGRKVVVTAVNDNLDPTTALNELQQHLSGGSVPNLVFAGTTSNETEAMLPILTRNKIVSMELAGSGITDSPYQFSLPDFLPNQAKALIDVIKSHFPTVKKIGIAITNDAFGTALLSAYKPAIAAAGLSDVVQTFPDTATNVTPELQALKAANPQVVIGSGYGAIGGYIVEDRATLGWTSVPMIGDGALSSNPLTAMVPKADLKNLDLLVQSVQEYKPLSQQSPAFQTFYKAVQAQGGNFSQSITLYTISWDELQLFDLAAKQAGTVTSSGVANALEHLNQPADKPYVTWSVEGFTPTLHVENAPLSDYGLAGPYATDGMNLPVGQS